MYSGTIQVHSSNAEGGDQSLPALIPRCLRLHWICSLLWTSIETLHCLELARSEAFNEEAKCLCYIKTRGRPVASALRVGIVLELCSNHFWLWEGGLKIDDVECWLSTLIHDVGERSYSNRFTWRDSGLKRASIDSLNTIGLVNNFCRVWPRYTAALSKFWDSVALMGLLWHDNILGGHWLC